MNGKLLNIILRIENEYIFYVFLYTGKNEVGGKMKDCSFELCE